MIGNVSLCVFKREKNSDWENGLKVYVERENEEVICIFDMNMNKPKVYDIWDNLGILSINLEPLIKSNDEHLAKLNEKYEDNTTDLKFPNVVAEGDVYPCSSYNNGRCGETSKFCDGCADIELLP